MADNGGTTISAYQFFKSFPDETSAITYIEGLRWADGLSALCVTVSAPAG